MDTARERILAAIHQAGQRRIDELLQRRQEQQAQRSAWQAPPTAAGLVMLLARREGGLIPLARFLKKAGLKGISPARLRAIARGKEVPAWRVLEQIGLAGDVADLAEARRDWEAKYRARLQGRLKSPLGIELRLLLAEASATLRALGAKLGFHYSVLIRDLKRIDRDEPIRWYHVERILRAVGLPEDGEHWREIHALWYTAAERRKKTAGAPRRRPFAPAGNGEAAADGNHKPSANGARAAADNGRAHHRG